MSSLAPTASLQKFDGVASGCTDVDEIEVFPTAGPLEYEDGIEFKRRCSRCQSVKQGDLFKEESNDLNDRLLSFAHVWLGKC